MNLKIKYRESFRPFAPAVLEESAADYFDLDTSSPYMLLVAKVRDERCIPPVNGHSEDILARLNSKRSEVPAITHVDYSARVQTVSREYKPDFYEVIKEFENLTGCPLVVNTSFNVRGEPIVCTPEDAYRCFMRTEMDVLVLGNMLLLKEEQSPWQESKEWRNELILD
jgi:carbamoyltransferase